MKIYIPRVKCFICNKVISEEGCIAGRYSRFQEDYIAYDFVCCVGNCFQSFDKMTEEDRVSLGLNCEDKKTVHYSDKLLDDDYPIPSMVWADVLTLNVDIKEGIRRKDYMFILRSVASCGMEFGKVGEDRTDLYYVRNFNSNSILEYSVRCSQVFKKIIASLIPDNIINDLIELITIDIAMIESPFVGVSKEGKVFVNANEAKRMRRWLIGIKGKNRLKIDERFLF